MGKREEKRPLGWSRCEWQDNIKRDLKRSGMDWIDLGLDRNRWQAVVNVVMNLWVFKNAGIS